MYQKYYPYSCMANFICFVRYKALTYSLATHLGLTPGLPSDGQNLELTPTANRAEATNK